MSLLDLGCFSECLCCELCGKPCPPKPDRDLPDDWDDDWEPDDDWDDFDGDPSDDDGDLWDDFEPPPITGGGSMVEGDKGGWIGGKIEF